MTFPKACPILSAGTDQALTGSYQGGTAYRPAVDRVVALCIEGECALWQTVYTDCGSTMAGCAFALAPFMVNGRYKG